MTTCAVATCGRTSHARGWCSTHYERWRKHGDHLAGASTPKGVPSRFLRAVVLTHTGDSCIDWPYARTGAGYGHMQQDGRDERIHYLVCEAIHGPPPTPDHDAAHSCGRGHEGCVSPAHLSWKTHAENGADMISHGTSPRGERHGQAKLTEGDVHQIRVLGNTLGHRKIAEAFDVSPKTVGSILRGENWGWLK